MGDAANPVNWSVFRPPFGPFASSWRPQIARIFAASHEGDALVIFCTGKTCTSGSNPGFSAIFLDASTDAEKQPWASGESGRGFRGKARNPQSSLLRVLRPSRADLRAKRPSVSLGGSR